MNCYKAEVLSEGIAAGKAHLIQMNPISYQKKDDEKRRLKKALELSTLELEELKLKHKENQEYISMQILMIQDPILWSKACKEIENGCSAVEGITKTICEAMSALADATSNYLKERTSDLKDIQTRILSNLAGEQKEVLSSPFILVAEELPPSFLIQNKQLILGIITKKGGFTSHGAILCRQWNLPYLICDASIKEEQRIILDTRKQQVLVDPSLSEFSEYEKMMHHLHNETYDAIVHNGFQFLANVSDNLGIEKALRYGFDGIGLYRTEMIFMNSNRPYTFEEQYEIYLEAVNQMREKSICFRTFDIGDDKQLSYVNAYKKGIDNYIHNPILFKTQIEALLKANQYNNMKIMFPMIKSNEEYQFLRKWVFQIQKEIKNSSHIEMGIMLETKEALDNLYEFENLDFISIGTNDLVLSIYHIHREVQTEQLKIYLEDLILQLKKVVSFCNQKSIVLSICGELAAIEPALREFIRLGIKNFSVATPAIKILNHIYKEFF